MDTTNEVSFHPTDDTKQKMENDRQKIAEHVSKHYRKYLFWIWMLCGLMISIVTWITFSTNKSNADFQLAPDIEAIAIFNQMDALAHKKDEFFHQKGKIYSLSGETLFKKYDTMYHVLDNAYHWAVTIDEKIEAAKQLEKFLNLQNALFASTAYTNIEDNIKFESLDSDFNEALKKISVKPIESIIETNNREIE